MRDKESSKMAVEFSLKQTRMDKNLVLWESGWRM